MRVVFTAEKKNGWHEIRERNKSALNYSTIRQRVI